MLRALVTRRLPAALLPGPAGGGGWAAAASAVHGSALAAASVQVKIPALGESISDGTVAAVLKQAGDRVEEDEPILQIETDKVTVDVRAPQAGVLEAILVKPDDNVEVGHVVASISDSDTAAAAPPPAQAQEAAATRQAEAPPEQPAKVPKQKKAAATAAPSQPAAAAPPPPEQAHAAAAHRTPSISFPPRRTPDGQLISALPHSEAQRLLAQMMGGGGDEAAGGADAAATVPDEYRDMIAVPIVGGSMPVLRGPPVPTGPPGPPRRTMSDREMEAIMLGGADD